VKVCHKCEKPRKHYRVRGRTAYACETCGNNIYPLTQELTIAATSALVKEYVLPETMIYTHELPASARSDG